MRTYPATTWAEARADVWPLRKLLFVGAEPRPSPPRVPQPELREASISARDKSFITMAATSLRSPQISLTRAFKSTTSSMSLLAVSPDSMTVANSVNPARAGRGTSWGTPPVQETKLGPTNTRSDPTADRSVPNRPRSDPARRPDRTQLARTQPRPDQTQPRNRVRTNSLSIDWISCVDIWFLHHAAVSPPC